MEPADPEMAAYIARWRPSSLSPQAAAFARDVIGQVAPQGQERAKNLLWAAGKLADYAIPLGLEPVPEVVLHPSVAERFTRCAPGRSGVARRTLRTNLRFVGRRVVPQLYPADMPLPREHAKAPYSPAEVAGYLALADAQPTPARRMHGSGLVCLGAGAGLIRAGAARPSPASPPQHRHNPRRHPVPRPTPAHPDHSAENTTCCPQQPRRPANQP